MDGTLLTIAGFDPSSGAGVTADLQVFAAHGWFGTSCVTALTEQSTRGVRATHAVAAAALAGALACLADDLPPTGVKLGVLATGENVGVVADFVSRWPGVPVVLDPVLVSSSGAVLLSEEGLAEMRERLLPLVTWVTPNRAELGRIVGRAIAGEQDVEDAVRELASRYPRLHVVVTGGDGAAADDFVAVQGATQWMRGERIESRSTHGTGCAFASALLCRVASGLGGLEAAHAAKEYVKQAILRAVPRGAGKGPMELLWPLREFAVSGG